MKQPASNTSHEPGLFNFTSKLEFEASSNLLRSRSDSCLRKHAKQLELPLVDLWTVPTVDFTFHHFHGHGPKYSRFETKKNQNKQRKTKDCVTIATPKFLGKPGSKVTPFVTTFRAPSARTSRILGVKDGMYSPGPYQAWEPHAFRGDQFRLDSGIRNRGRPPFVTSYPRDPRNLELQKNSISAHADCLGANGLGTTERKEKQARFLTCAEQQPKWDRNLTLEKEKYQRGLLDEEKRMNSIMKQLSWYTGKTFFVPKLNRPDIKDFKTVDWLQVTKHSQNETTVLR